MVLAMEKEDNRFIIKANSFVARSIYKCLSSGSMKSYGVIIMAVLRELGTTHFILGSAFALQICICYVSSPFAGQIQRYTESKQLYVFGGILAATGYLSHALLKKTTIWHLFFCSVITGIGFGFANVSSIVIMKETFQDSFSTAYGITLFASYFGISTLPLLSEYIVNSFNIHINMTVLGIFCLAFIPVGMFLPKSKYSGDVTAQPSTTSDSTEQCDQEGNGSAFLKDEGNEKCRLFDDSGNVKTDKAKQCPQIMESKQTKREKDHTVFGGHRDFVLLLIAGVCFGYNISSWHIYSISFGEFVGLNSSTAVLMSTFGGIGGGLGDAYAVFLFYTDQVNFCNGFALPSLLIVLSYIITLVASDFTAMSFYAALSGFGIAVQGMVCMGLLPSSVCEKHFRAAVVITYFAEGIAWEIGGALSGALIDVTGSYYMVFGLFAFVNLILAFVSFSWWVVRKQAT